MERRHSHRWGRIKGWGWNKGKLPKDSQRNNEPHEQGTWSIKTNGQNESSKQRVCKVPAKRYDFFMARPLQEIEHHRRGANIWN